MGGAHLLELLGTYRRYPCVRAVHYQEVPFMGAANLWEVLTFSGVGGTKPLGGAYL